MKPKFPMCCRSFFRRPGLGRRWALPCLLWLSTGLGGLSGLATEAAAQTTGTVQFSGDTLFMQEAGGSSDRWVYRRGFHVAVTGPGETLLRITATDGTAILGTDYRVDGTDSEPNVLVIHSERAEFGFWTRPDMVDTPNKWFTITLTTWNNSPALSLGPRTTATVYILDDDPTVATLTRAGTGAINEGQTVEFAVTLSRELAADEVIDVPLAISGDGVTTGDWTLAEKTGADLNTGVNLYGASTATPKVRFGGQGAQTARLILTAANDNIYESGGAETFTVALGPNGAGANGFDRPDTHTNVGGGADPSETENSFNVRVHDVIPTIAIGGGDAVAEGAAASFTVSASSAPAANLTVNLTVEDAEGSDFVSSANEGSGKTVTINANETDASYTVATVDDTGDGADEPNGEITVTVNAGNGYAAGSSSSASVTVNDNDATAVTLDGPAGNITEGSAKNVTLTIGRGLVRGETLTAPLTFSGTADRNADYTLAGMSAAGVAYNNLNSGNATVVFTGPNSGSTDAVATIALTAANDNSAEDTPETVIIGLGALSQTGLGGGATGIDNLANFSIEDPPVPEITIRGGNAVTEGETAIFTVSASSAPAANLTVNLTVEDAAGSDFVSSTNKGSGKTVTIDANETDASYTVATVDDGVDEANGSVTVTVNNGDGYAVGSPSSASVNVNDNDEAAPPPTTPPPPPTPTPPPTPPVTLGEVTLSASPNPVAEGEEVTITATLSQTLDSAVTIPLAITATTAEEGDYGELASIEIAENQTSAAGAIATAKDDDTDDETFTVALGTLPAGLIAGTPASVEVTIADAGEVTSAERIDEEIPEAFALEQNYPNPFNPSTSIEFALDKPQRVTLAVYDMLGHEARVLIDGVRPAARYSVSFDAADLASGTYLYVLRTEERIAVKTMSLVK